MADSYFFNYRYCYSFYNYKRFQRKSWSDFAHPFTAGRISASSEFTKKIVYFVHHELILVCSDISSSYLHICRY